MLILGIDPGTSGGIAIVKVENKKLPTIIFGSKIPIVTIYGKKIIDTKRVVSKLNNFSLDIAIIEKVHAMPRQGVTSSFQFGRSFGSIEALSYLNCKRVDYVAPAVWKKFLGLGSTKKDSLDLARLKFGDLEYWKFKGNDGIAEAALLTLFWIEKHIKL